MAGLEGDVLSSWLDFVYWIFGLRSGRPEEDSLAEHTATP